MPDVMRIENNDASILYDFLDASNLQVEEETHTWQMSRDNLVIETVDLVKNDTPANIRGEVVALEEILEDAVRWHTDRYRDDPYWWRWVTTGETAKRALIYNYALLPLNGRVFSPHLTRSSAAYRLALTRHRAFEAISATTGSTTGVSLTGGMWNLTGTISGGTLNGRIAKLTANIGGGQNSKIWFGFRPTRNGVTTFSPIFNCEDWSGAASDSSVVSSANTQGGQYQRITFAGTPGLAARGLHTLNSRVGGAALSATAVWEDFVGRYTLLLRYRMSNASTTVGVQIRPQYFSGQLNIQEEVYLANEDNWQIVEVGELEIPAGGLRGSISAKDFADFGFYVYAERIEGSGELHLDCIILMPQEHSVVVEGNMVGEVDIITNPDDTVDAYRYLTSFNNAVIEKPSAGPDNWEYPEEGGLLVVAGSGIPGTDHSVSDTTSLSIEVIKRYGLYHE